MYIECTYVSVVYYYYYYYSLFGSLNIVCFPHHFDDTRSIIDVLGEDMTSAGRVLRTSSYRYVAVIIIVYHLNSMEDHPDPFVFVKHLPAPPPYYPDIAANVKPDISFNIYNHFISHITYIS